MPVTFELRLNTRGGQRVLNHLNAVSLPKGCNRVTIWACREDKSNPRRFSLNKHKLQERFDEILAWIDSLKTDDRPAVEIAAELGLARIIWDTALGGEVAT